MVRRRHGDHRAGKRIELEQDRAHHSLNLPGLVGIATFLAHHIELVEEQDATPGPGEVEELGQAQGGLAQVACDDALVPDYKQRGRQLGGDRLGKAGLAVARAAHQEDTVPRLEVMRSKQILGPPVLLDQLLDRGVNRGREDQIPQPPLWRALVHQELEAPRRAEGHHTGAPGRRLEMAFQSVSQHVMLLRALFDDQGLHRPAEQGMIAARASAHEVDEKVAPSHADSSSVARARPPMGLLCHPGVTPRRGAIIRFRVAPGTASRPARTSARRASGRNPW